MSKITLELDDDAIAAAKAANIDLSDFLLKALYRYLPNLHASERAEIALTWQEKNREAIESYNRFVEEHGLFYACSPDRAQG